MNSRQVGPCFGPLDTQANRAGSLERHKCQPRACRVGTDGIAAGSDREDGGEEEMLGGRVPAAVVVEVDPQVVLCAGVGPVRVAVSALGRVIAAGEWIVPSRSPAAATLRIGP